MKKIKLVAVILFIGLIAISCTKEETGPQGVAGKDGANGNADVALYSYGSQTFEASNGYINDFKFPGTSNGKLDSSMVVSYYLANNDLLWYAVGQVGPLSTYQTRSWTSNNTEPILSVYSIALTDANGTAYSGSDVEWDSVRIFVVPANTFTSAVNQKVSFDDYETVSVYFDKE